MAAVWKRTDRDCWVVDYKDAQGGRRRLFADTREQAEDLLAEKIRESRQAAPPVEDPEIALRNYAARWIARVATGLARKTHRGYAETLDRHILPAFGSLKLRALQRRHIEDFLAGKRADGLSKNVTRTQAICSPKGAPITYVAAQLGHARPTTTLAHDAHWIPRGDKGWVDKLAARRAAAAEEVGTKSWHQTGSPAEGVPEVTDMSGAGGGS